MKYILMSMVAAWLLLCTTISAAADFSVVYTSVIQPDSSVVLHVTVINTGVDAVYATVLAPSGMLANAAQVNLGDLAAGDSASFQVSNAMDPGYLVFSGSGQDALGNPVEFDVVGAGQ